MKVLSWDLGIKNLAYCLLDDDKIAGWGVIDLRDNIKLKCVGVCKSGIPCPYKAVDNGRCVKHQESQDVLVETICAGITKAGQACTRKPTLADQGHLWCKLHVPTDKGHLFSIKQTSCKNLPLLELGKVVTVQLDKY